MAEANSERRRDSNSELLHELQSLSQSLFQSNANHRTASLVLDRSSVINESARSERGSQSHRISASPWQSNANQQANNHSTFLVEATASREKKKKKGIWNWKPLRALSHVRMQHVACLFSVEVVSIQGLPASTNGLRLSVSVRKKETKEGAVMTIPSRVMHGSAEFEETLFVRCHLYYNGRPPVFEPRLFLISVVAVDAPEIELGTSTVDLSLLVKESVARSFEGERVRKWDMNFELSGKAKGGELVLKLGFQIMEEGGVSIYSQAKGKDIYSSSYMNKLSVQKSEAELKEEDLDFPKLDIVDKGIEEVAGSREDNDDDEAKSEETVESPSVSREVVKEVVHQRILELESIAKQIKDIESTMTRDGSDLINMTERKGLQQLNAGEETVTRRFLQMLELGDDKEHNKRNLEISSEIEAATEGGNETGVLIADLGKGLGPVVQTRDGGYLASMNPLDMKVEIEETPKLAMQISRPFILQDQKLDNGLEVFQKLAAMGPEELVSKLLSLTDMDELMGKTAEQVAFEGVAAAIISGRNKEGASFSAARSITTVKMMARSMVDGRNARRNSKEEPMTVEEMLAFSLQKIEAMAVEGLKIQAEMVEEEAPSDVSNQIAKEVQNHLLDSVISLEKGERTCDSYDSVKILVTIQLRDATRRYEPVGGLQIAVVEAVGMGSNGEDDEMRFKEMGIHVGGLKLQSVEGQRQRLSAMQWLVGIGMGKTKLNKKVAENKKTKDIVWSLSSRLMENMWLQPTRNPNVKFL